MKLYTIKLEPSVSVGCEHWVSMPKVHHAASVLVQMALRGCSSACYFVSSWVFVTIEWLRVWVLKSGGADSFLCDSERVTNLL